MSDKRFKSLRDYVNAQPRTLTQGDISKILGISENLLSQYLNERCVPGRESALRLSREFDISLEGLLDPASQAA